MSSALGAIRSITSIGLYSRVFSIVPRDINLRWCDVLERLAYEPVCLCAVQRIERIKPLANALHRTSTPVLGNRLQQLLAFAETPSIEQKTLAVPEADLADHRLDAGIDPSSVGRIRPPEAGAPQSDAVRIHLGQRLNEAYRVANIVDLFQRD